MVKFLSSKEGMGKAVTKMFRDLDLDGSGDVDIAEFVGGMKKLGLEFTDAQFGALHHDCDTDGDGNLTLKEFVNSCKTARAQMDARKAAMKESLGSKSVPRGTAEEMKKKVEAAKGK
eukprot:CAMPEP_0182560608 /NCGR_PEP_ID=MMETSP1324-20130603/3218_1 /TAXON_ID=236786 /ORGANISM="Florenciella sp., Strain RCC1587" /LENGTH=116 /DNA_ID=CAMNT_0024772961 /DNA_START=51 /DNA_END=401 /DNA_ORIENTATION=-